MPNYRLYLFGAPRLEYQGQLVAIDTRKALALLAYLLIENQPQSRDVLAALLWPESDQSAARAALRRTLSPLRSALKPDLIDFGRDVIAIHPGNDLWCDVIEFRARLSACHSHGHSADQTCPNCLISFLEAIDLYQADFMTGFGLRDSAAFDDWQFFESDRLRRELSSILERLVWMDQNQGDFFPAIEHARRWLSLDALNESAHRALISLYAQNGQRNAALRQYRECVRILDQELGVAPLDETTQVYEAVKENRFEKPVPSDQPAPDVDESHITVYQALILAPTPLIGRVSEWETLTRLYDGLRQNGVFAALTGETGIGKTRLAGDFITHLRDRGTITLKTRCYEGESNLAYTPLIDLLRQGLQQAEGDLWWQQVPAHWLAEAAQLLPELLQINPNWQALTQLEGPGAQYNFYEGLCQVLAALLAGAQVGVVWIDDLHLADQSTLDWLAYLIRRLGSHPFFLLATWESESQSPIQHIQQTLSADYVKILPLSPLTGEQSEALIQTYRGEIPLSEEYKTWLVNVSGGRPYFLLAYLEAIQQGKISAITPEVWPIPESLQTVWMGRLTNLSETTRQIVEAAAVIGRVFELDLLQAASGRSEDEIILSIEELFRWGLIVEFAVPSLLGEYVFKYEQIHALVLDEISLARRRLLHRRTANALQERSRRQSAAALDAQIAFHYQQAGRLEQAAESYYEAGKAARAIYANSEALAYFQSASALGYPHKVAVQVQIGELYTLRGDYPQAIQQFEAAAAFCARHELPPIEYKIGLVYLRRGRWEQAACHFEAALSDLDALATEEQKAFAAQTNVDWSLACHRSGNAEKAAALAEKALALAEQAEDPLALAQVHNLLGVLARARQQLERALAHLQDSLTFARKLENRAAQIAALNNLALAQADLNEPTKAIKTIQAALAECVTLGDRHLEAALRNNLADILRANGEPEAAMEQLKQAVTIFAEIGQQVENWEPEIWKLVDW